MRAFQAIKEEIVRQYEIGRRTDETHDTKAGIMLGFIMLVLASIIVREDVLRSIFGNRIATVFFSLGVAGILYALYEGFRGYAIREYVAGANLPDLLTQYRKGKKRNYENVIMGAIYNAYKENQKITERKTKAIKRMFASFLSGFLVILGSILWTWI
ncbi:MAG: hypothetical protein OXR66_03595 [Candidatus Woesearchaeota archaeon]|nr:hypothetical protein [Candidatus Woesearchaeota archaeon]